MIQVGQISRFNQSNVFEAYVSQMSCPPWNSPTVLMAVVGQDGEEIQIIGQEPIKKKQGQEKNTGYASLKDLVAQRVYVFAVPNSCVKMNTSKQKSGFTHACEIKSYYAFDVKLSVNGFVPAINYNLCMFHDLMQKEPGNIVSVHGRVVTEPIIDSVGLLKLVFEIQHGLYAVLITFTSSFQLYLNL